jgi:hypothetical protein
MAAAEALRLTPLILLSLLAEPEAVAGREVCARLLGNLALMLALIINNMEPSNSLSLPEAAQLCQAAEAGVRFLPQLGRLLAEWQHDEAAQRLAASGHASAAAKLALTLRALWDHAWEVAREFHQQSSAGALMDPLFQLHSAGCRTAHACAAFSEAVGREQPSALPQLPGAAWAGAYSSHAQVANVALLVSIHAAAPSGVEADKEAAMRWGYCARICTVYEHAGRLAHSASCTSHIICTCVILGCLFIVAEPPAVLCCAMICPCSQAAARTAGGPSQVPCCAGAQGSCAGAA